MSQKRKSSSTVTTKKSSRTVSRTKKDSIVGDLDFEDLDFQYCYSVKELELINNYLRVNPNFEIINRKLISISYTPIAIEAVVHEIARQLGNWNVETNKDGLGIVTTSNGGYDFRDTNLQKIQAPDVAFTPEDTYLSLDEKQLWSFEGQPFTPIFIVKVANIKNSEVEKEVNNKIKKDYFAHGTSVKLGWDKNGSPYRRRQPWEDLDAGDILPDFTLELEMINDIIDKDSASDDDKEEEEEDDDDDDEGKKRRKRIDDDDDDEGKKRRKKVKKNEAECPYCDLEINTASKWRSILKNACKINLV
ncbi:unnamed protein product [Rhizophagus irregularis]|nr:unnamed protein product [Rhizophagus irregularis]